MKKVILLATLCLAVNGDFELGKFNKDIAQQYMKSSKQTFAAAQNFNQQLIDYVKKNPALKPECSYAAFKGRKSCETDADCNSTWEYCDDNCKKCRSGDWAV